MVEFAQWWEIWEHLPGLSFLTHFCIQPDFNRNTQSEQIRKRFSLVSLCGPSLLSLALRSHGADPLSKATISLGKWWTSVTCMMRIVWLLPSTSGICFSCRWPKFCKGIVILRRQNQIKRELEHFYMMVGSNAQKVLFSCVCICIALAYRSNRINL